MDYRPTPFEELIKIDSMVTVHYFQFARGYVFEGERHDFWELVYMDKGSAEIGADGRPFLLGEGEIAFHKPGEFHTIWAGGEKAPDIIILSFVCRSPAMARFAGARMTVDEEGKRLIAQVIVEARSAWSNKLGSGYLNLVPREGAPAGASQMVRLSMEALLIRLLRALDRAECAGMETELPSRPQTAAGRREYLESLAAGIEQFIADHMDDRITIGSLCRRFNMSPTSMKVLFRSRTGKGVNEYLTAVRHEAAKRLIREGRLNLSTIAERCGYSSIHYFSRRFSQLEGMTPSEYARSVKSMTGIPEEL